MTVTANIDLGAPTMNNVNARAGKCRAFDPLSGVASCVVHKFRVGRHLVRWTAVATDRAGNVEKVFGHYRV